MSKALQASETLADGLKDREREILAILVLNGGSARQKEIVDEVGIAKGEISRRISALDDGGHIEKVELGLENVLYLPGCEPEIVQSSLGRSYR
ncbi:IclR-like transcriptional regulator [Halosimplex carlsbadense 2-9-1]|uniref:IclR-like transcriptional regulator n=1 Tax=Halosimplex carlsbadense 2-9-1 TaxID=797114 RepID=M0CI80_9EURY|nr:MarR family transcriptional regulator [Halosimplex carlsbadense]ELZ21584.1 IclR-like transcriptional regulator [Halosimplex carlsbadense 2-9-1]